MNPAGDLLVRGAEVRGRIVDVAVRAGRIAAVGPHLAGEEALRCRDDGAVVEAHGGALLPALHDHHVHLLATAAALSSVDCTTSLDPLRGHAARRPAGEWVRGVGTAESVDRHVLDALVPEHSVRLQHRSGALWMLNSVALTQVAHVLDTSDDVERDSDGAPTGRLWRYDQRLRPALGDRTALVRQDLAVLLGRLRGLGIGSLTDATPDLDATAVRLLAGLPLPVTLLGDPHGTAPVKIHLRDHDLPALDDLMARIAAAREQDRAVAVHCVTREALFLTLAALDEVGRHPQDRIEHAAVVPDPAWLAGLTVVTQPGFIARRGDDYLRDVHPEDRDGLYRWRSLRRAGVRVLPSSDAPHGPLDPWHVIAAARERRTPQGVVLGATEQVSAREALAGYLCDAWGRERVVEVGAPAALTLLHVPLVRALADPSAGWVRECWWPRRPVGGQAGLPSCGSSVQAPETPH